MKLVVLSGGSGKRLWPLSNEARSKQFLRMLHNPDGTRESMIQRLWKQLESNPVSDEVYISTSPKHAELIQSQLGSKVCLITEPEPRDTFPAIALVSAYFHSELAVGPGEVITVMPVDPYVGDSFFTTIKQVEHVLHLSNADLALVGVAPTYPSTKYGYIIPAVDGVDKNSKKPYQNVIGFQEKPSEREANMLIDRHALWNCGVFSFRLEYMIEELKKRGWPADYHRLLGLYGDLPSISFDYEIVEKAERVVVVPYAGYWKDLGTWNTLIEEIGAQVTGERIITEGCTNTHIISELDLPVVAIGLSDVVVAASPDGILVSHKSHSHLVKQVTKDLEQRPMYEERRWGIYQVLDYQKTGENWEILTKSLHIHAGKNISYQYHRNRSEVWVIVAGEGEFVLNDRMCRVRPGDVAEIPAGARHAIKALTDLNIIEVQMGSRLEEEDIVRLAVSWDEIRERENQD